MNDAMTYHRWALGLARHYGDIVPVLSPDDVYQIAMVGLLELWRKSPEATEAMCKNAMRWAVTAELKRVYAKRTVPIEQVAETPTKDDQGARLDLLTIMERLNELPDHEFAAIGLILMGAHPRQIGLPAKQMSRVLQLARQRMRSWTREAS